MSTRTSSITSIWMLMAALVCVVSLLAATSLVPSAVPAAPAAPAAPVAAAAKYIGAAKCKNCHSAEKTGAQYAQWEKMLHSKAFETLAGDKAKELAKAKGIDDPQKSDACLKCHVTGHGEPAESFAKGFKPEMGVQCESCHGPGDAHLKARMAAAAETDPSKVAPVTATEIVGQPTIDTCLKCHNPESPSYKPFCFKEAHAKVAHLDPTKTRTPEELKKLSDPNGCEAAGSCKCPRPAAAEGK